MSLRHALAVVIPCLSIALVSVLRAQQVSATLPASAPTAPTTKSYAIENHGDLTLAIPAGWSEQEEPAQPGIPRTLRLSDPSGKFDMLISILPPPRDMPDFNSKTKLRAIAEAQGKHLLATAKETSVTLEEIRSAPGGGFVYTFTDKSPAPGSYEYISGGVVGVGDLILSTTMLMHERNPPQRATAIDVLASAAQAKPGPSNVAGANGATSTSTAPTAQAPTPEMPPTTMPTPTPPTATAPASQAAPPVQRLAVALPDRTWQLALDQAGLQILQDEMSPDRKARHLSAVDANSGVNISIFMEPAATIGDAKVARSFFFDRLRRSPMHIREDKFTDAGDIARVDYLLPDVNQRHANLYLSKEGVWIDVHISVEDAKNEKQSLIDEIAKSVMLEAKRTTRKP